MKTRLGYRLSDAWCFAVHRFFYWRLEKYCGEWLPMRVLSSSVEELNFSGVDCICYWRCEKCEEYRLTECKE